MCDEGVVPLDDLLISCWWMTAKENGPMRRPLSSVGVVDIMFDAFCSNSVKEMISGKWAVAIWLTRQLGLLQWHGPGQSCPRMHLFPHLQCCGQVGLL